MKRPGTVNLSTYIRRSKMTASDSTRIFSLAAIPSYQLRTLRTTRLSVLEFVHSAPVVPVTQPRRSYRLLPSIIYPGKAEPNVPGMDVFCKCLVR